MPTAPWITPTLDSPRSRRSIATTTTKTLNAPRIIAWSTTNPSTTSTPSLARTPAKPSRTSARRGRRGTGRARHPRVVQPDQERSRDQPAGTGEHEHGGHVVDGHQQRRHQRADDHAERVQPAAHDVHRRELVGGAAEQRHQGRVAGPVRREGDRGHDRQAVDHHGGTAGDQDRRDRERGQPSDQAGRDQQPLRRPPVGVRRDDGGQQGRRHEPEHADDADRERAAVRVGDQADGHHERPLRRERRSERQQRADQGAVAQQAQVHRPTLTRVSRHSRVPGGEASPRTLRAGRRSRPDAVSRGERCATAPTVMLQTMPPRDIDAVLARLATLEADLTTLTAELMRLQGIIERAGLSAEPLVGRVGLEPTTQGL